MKRMQRLLKMRMFAPVFVLVGTFAIGMNLLAERDDDGQVQQNSDSSGDAASQQSVVQSPEPFPGNLLMERRLKTGMVSLDTDGGDNPMVAGCIITTPDFDACEVTSDFSSVEKDVCIDGTTVREYSKSVAPTNTCNAGGVVSGAKNCNVICTSGGICATKTVEACNYPPGRGTNVGYCDCN